MSALDRPVGRGCGIGGLLTDVSVLAARAMPALADTDGAEMMHKLGLLQRMVARPNLSAAQKDKVLGRLEGVFNKHIKPHLAVATAAKEPVTGSAKPNALATRFTRLVNMHTPWLDQDIALQLWGQPLTPWANTTSRLLASEPSAALRQLAFDKAVLQLGHAVALHDRAHPGGSPAMQRFIDLHPMPATR